MKLLDPQKMSCNKGINNELALKIYDNEKKLFLGNLILISTLKKMPVEKNQCMNFYRTQKSMYDFSKEVYFVTIK